MDVLNLLEEKNTVTVEIERELHLDAGTYLIYDYWNRRFLGESKGKFDLTLEACASAVLAVHKKQNIPQFLSSSRHVSQGAMELADISWDQNRYTLTGVSRVIKDDPYEIVLYIPQGWSLLLEGNDTSQAGWKTEGPLARLTVAPKETCELRWSVQFMKVQS